MKALLFLLVGLLLIVASLATPSLFLGGNFQQADGVYSPSFAAFDTTTNTWAENIPDPQVGGGRQGILGMAAAGNGVFVVGDFTQILGGVPSQSVAFFNGTNWCAIRQGLNNMAGAVACDSATSCYVAGPFTGAVNLASNVSVGVFNFAHYVLNSGNEWVIDQTVVSSVGAVLPAQRMEMVLLPGSPVVAFAAPKNPNVNIFRWTSADGKWVPFIGQIPVDNSLVVGWSLDTTGSGGPNLYLVTNAAVSGGLLGSNFMVSGRSTLTTTCSTGYPCLSASAFVAFIPNQNASLIARYADVAVTNGVRYLLALYSPDGNAFGYRFTVLSQSGSSNPTPLGTGFDFAPVPPTTANTQYDLFTFAGQPLVWGVSGGNLYYPPGTSDLGTTGVKNDIRYSDVFSGVAIYNSTLQRWVQAFGGGFDADLAAWYRSNNNPVVDNGPGVPMTVNSNTNQVFFAYSNNGISGNVYNLNAPLAVYYDDQTTSYYPLFDRYVSVRDYQSTSVLPGQVYDIICDGSSNCGTAYVGGWFNFHGPASIGAAVVQVVVQQSGSPQITSVGGGLWLNGNWDSNDNTTNNQLVSGWVDSLVTDGQFLFAGGFFARTARGSSTGYVCLNNVASISVTSSTAMWQDLGGGCDAEVYVLQLWNGELFAGGSMQKCGTAIVNYVGSYSYQASSPTWNSLNNGVDNVVHALEVFAGRLIAGGSFYYAGGIPTNGIAAWNGVAWAALLPACTNDCYYNAPYYNVLSPSPQVVYALRRDASGNFLYAGGRGTFFGKTANYLLQWHYTSGDNGQWFVQGTGTPSGALANFGSGQILYGVNSYPIIWDPSLENLENGNTFVSVNVWDNPQNVRPSYSGGFIEVARGPDGGAGSASTLSSFVLSLLRLFL
jgi:hypothetical protein